MADIDRDSGNFRSGVFVSTTHYPQRGVMVGFESLDFTHRLDPVIQIPKRYP